MANEPIRARGDDPMVGPDRDALGEEGTERPRCPLAQSDAQHDERRAQRDGQPRVVGIEATGNARAAAIAETIDTTIATSAQTLVPRSSTLSSGLDRVYPTPPASTNHASQTIATRPSLNVLIETNHESFLLARSTSFAQAAPDQRLRDPARHHDSACGNRRGKSSRPDHSLSPPARPSRQVRRSTRPGGPCRLGVVFQSGPEG